MSTDNPDPSKKIAQKNDSTSTEDTPEVGVGLLLLGALCLVIGIGIGLIFSLK